MSVEIEIKLRIGETESFCGQLGALGAGVFSSRHFEENYLLDFPDGKLKSKQCLIRIRRARGESILTFKGPLMPRSVFKTREELETRLEDGEVALRILEQLDMRVWFRYQKYRREFSVILKSPEEKIIVAVDETPVGNYAELEGSEEGIRRLARLMGFDESEFLRESYYSLYLDYCRKRGDPFTHMIFPDSLEV